LNDIADLQSARKGEGAFLQRDYWAVIDACALSPTEVVALVRERFEEFPPGDLLVCNRENGDSRSLEPGDTLSLKVRWAGKTGVRVVHADDNSLTLATLRGHPEAGRITFGCYRNERRDVLFHIRSRARSSTALNLAGFMTAGDPMQTNCWTDFIDRLAHTVGEGVISAIFVETRELHDDEEADIVDRPTFIARGD
jgi:hypothetical protein